MFFKGTDRLLVLTSPLSVIDFKRGAKTPMSMWSAVQREDCFRDPRITVYTLPRGIRRSDLELLRPFGPISVFEKFSRPFFKLDRPFLFALTGILGSPEIRVTFKRSASPHVRGLLERQLDKMAGRTGCGEGVRFCPRAAMAPVFVGGFSISGSACASCLECVAELCDAQDRAAVATE